MQTSLTTSRATLLNEIDSPHIFKQLIDNKKCQQNISDDMDLVPHKTASLPENIQARIYTEKITNKHSERSGLKNPFSTTNKFKRSCVKYTTLKTVNNLNNQTSNKYLLSQKSFETAYQSMLPKNSLCINSMKPGLNNLTENIFKHRAPDNKKLFPWIHGKQKNQLFHKVSGSNIQHDLHKQNIFQNKISEINFEQLSRIRYMKPIQSQQTKENQNIKFEENISHKIKKSPIINDQSLRSSDSIISKDQQDINQGISNRKAQLSKSPVSSVDISENNKSANLSWFSNLSRVKNLDNNLYVKNLIKNEENINHQNFISFPEDRKIKNSNSLNKMIINKSNNNHLIKENIVNNLATSINTLDKNNENTLSSSKSLLGSENTIKQNLLVKDDIVGISPVSSKKQKENVGCIFFNNYYNETDYLKNHINSVSIPSMNVSSDTTCSNIERKTNSLAGYKNKLELMLISISNEYGQKMNTLQNTLVNSKICVINGIKLDWSTETSKKLLISFGSLTKGLSHIFGSDMKLLTVNDMEKMLGYSIIKTDNWQPTFYLNSKVPKPMYDCQFSHDFLEQITEVEKIFKSTDTLDNKSNDKPIELNLVKETGIINILDIDFNINTSNNLSNSLTFKSSLYEDGVTNDTLKKNVSDRDVVKDISEIPIIDREINSLNNHIQLLTTVIEDETTDRLKNQFLYKNDDKNILDLTSKNIFDDNSDCDEFDRNDSKIFPYEFQSEIFVAPQKIQDNKNILEDSFYSNENFNQDNNNILRTENILQGKSEVIKRPSTTLKCQPEVLSQSSFDIEYNNLQQNSINHDEKNYSAKQQLETISKLNMFNNHLSSLENTNFIDNIESNDDQNKVNIAHSNDDLYIQNDIKTILSIDKFSLEFIKSEDDTTKKYNENIDNKKHSKISDTYNSSKIPYSDVKFSNIKDKDLTFSNFYDIDRNSNMRYTVCTENKFLTESEVCDESIKSNFSPDYTDILDPREISFDKRISSNKSTSNFVKDDFIFDAVIKNKTSKNSNSSSSKDKKCEYFSTEQKWLNIKYRFETTNRKMQKILSPLKTRKILTSVSQEPSKKTKKYFYSSSNILYDIIGYSCKIERNSKIVTPTIITLRGSNNSNIKNNEYRTKNVTKRDFIIDPSDIYFSNCLDFNMVTQTRSKSEPRLNIRKSTEYENTIKSKIFNKDSFASGTSKHLLPYLKRAGLVEFISDLAYHRYNEMINIAKAYCSGKVLKKQNITNYIPIKTLISKNRFSNVALTYALEIAAKGRIDTFVKSLSSRDSSWLKSGFYLVKINENKLIAINLQNTCLKCLCDVNCMTWGSIARNAIRGKEVISSDIIINQELSFSNKAKLSYRRTKSISPLNFVHTKNISLFNQRNYLSHQRGKPHFQNKKRSRDIDNIDRSLKVDRIININENHDDIIWSSDDRCNVDESNFSSSKKIIQHEITESSIKLSNQYSRLNRNIICNLNDRILENNSVTSVIPSAKSFEAKSNDYNSENRNITNLPNKKITNEGSFNLDINNYDLHKKNNSENSSNASLNINHIRQLSQNYKFDHSEKNIDDSVDFLFNSNLKEQGEREFQLNSKYNFIYNKHNENSIYEIVNNEAYYTNDDIVSISTNKSYDSLIESKYIKMDKSIKWLSCKSDNILALDQKMFDDLKETQLVLPKKRYKLQKCIIKKYPYRNIKINRLIRSDVYSNHSNSTLKRYSKLDTSERSIIPSIVKSVNQDSPTSRDSDNIFNKTKVLDNIDKNESLKIFRSSYRINNELLRTNLKLIPENKILPSLIQSRNTNKIENLVKSLNLETRSMEDKSEMNNKSFEKAYHKNYERQNTLENGLIKNFDNQNDTITEDITNNKKYSNSIVTLKNLSNNSTLKINENIKNKNNISGYGLTHNNQNIHFLKSLLTTTLLGINSYIYGSQDNNEDVILSSLSIVSNELASCISVVENFVSDMRHIQMSLPRNYKNPENLVQSCKAPHSLNCNYEKESIISQVLENKHINLNEHNKQKDSISRHDQYLQPSIDNEITSDNLNKDSQLEIPEIYNSSKLSKNKIPNISLSNTKRMNKLNSMRISYPAFRLTDGLQYENPIFINSYKIYDDTLDSIMSSFKNFPKNNYDSIKKKKRKKIFNYDTNKARFYNYMCNEAELAFLNRNTKKLRALAKDVIRNQFSVKSVCDLDTHKYNIAKKNSNKNKLNRVFPYKLSYSNSSQNSRITYQQSNCLSKMTIRLRKSLTKKSNMIKTIVQKSPIYKTQKCTKSVNKQRNNDNMKSSLTFLDESKEENNKYIFPIHKSSSIFTKKAYQQHKLDQTIQAESSKYSRILQKNNSVFRYQDEKYIPFHNIICQKRLSKSNIKSYKETTKLYNKEKFSISYNNTKGYNFMFASTGTDMMNFNSYDTDTLQGYNYIKTRYNLDYNLKLSQKLAQDNEFKLNPYLSVSNSKTNECLPKKTFLDTIKLDCTDNGNKKKYYREKKSAVIRSFSSNQILNNLNNELLQKKEYKNHSYSENIRYNSKVNNNKTQIIQQPIKRYSKYKILHNKRNMSHIDITPDKNNTISIYPDSYRLSTKKNKIIKEHKIKEDSYDVESEKRCNFDFITNNKILSINDSKDENSYNSHTSYMNDVTSQRNFNISSIESHRDNSQIKSIAFLFRTPLFSSLECDYNISHNYNKSKILPDSQISILTGNFSVWSPYSNLTYKNKTNASNINKLDYNYAFSPIRSASFHSDVMYIAGSTNIRNILPSPYDNYNKNAFKTPYIRCENLATSITAPFAPAPCNLYGCKKWSKLNNRLYESTQINYKIRSPFTRYPESDKKKLQFLQRDRKSTVCCKERGSSTPRPCVNLLYCEDFCSGSIECYDTKAQIRRNFKAPFTPSITSLELDSNFKKNTNYLQESINRNDQQYQQLFVDALLDLKPNNKAKDCVPKKRTRCTSMPSVPKDTVSQMIGEYSHISDLRAARKSCFPSITLPMQTLATRISTKGSATETSPGRILKRQYSLQNRFPNILCPFGSFGTVNYNEFSTKLPKFYNVNNKNKFLSDISKPYDKINKLTPTEILNKKSDQQKLIINEEYNKDKYNIKDDYTCILSNSRNRTDSYLSLDRKENIENQTSNIVKKHNLSDNIFHENYCYSKKDTKMILPRYENLKHCTKCNITENDIEPQQSHISSYTTKEQSYSECDNSRYSNNKVIQDSGMKTILYRKSLSACQFSHLTSRFPDFDTDNISLQTHGKYVDKNRSHYEYSDQDSSLYHLKYNTGQSKIYSGHHILPSSGNTSLPNDAVSQMSLSCNDLDKEISFDKTGFSMSKIITQSNRGYIFKKKISYNKCYSIPEYRFLENKNMKRTSCSLNSGTKYNNSKNISLNIDNKQNNSFSLYSSSPLQLSTPKYKGLKRDTVKDLTKNTFKRFRYNISTEQKDMMPEPYGSLILPRLHSSNKPILQSQKSTDLLSIDTQESGDVERDIWHERSQGIFPNLLTLCNNSSHSEKKISSYINKETNLNLSMPSVNSYSTKNFSINNLQHNVSTNILNSVSRNNHTTNLKPNPREMSTDKISLCLDYNDNNSSKKLQENCPSSISTNSIFKQRYNISRTNVPTSHVSTSLDYLDSTNLKNKFLTRSRQNIFEPEYNKTWSKELSTIGGKLLNIDNNKRVARFLITPSLLIPNSDELDENDSRNQHTESEFTTFKDTNTVTKYHFFTEKKSRKIPKTPNLKISNRSYSNQQFRTPCLAVCSG